MKQINIGWPHWCVAMGLLISLMTWMFFRSQPVDTLSETYPPGSGAVAEADA